jgi:hypothetical protein
VLPFAERTLQQLETKKFHMTYICNVVKVSHWNVFLLIIVTKAIKDTDKQTMKDKEKNKYRT